MKALMAVLTASLCFCLSVSFPGERCPSELDVEFMASASVNILEPLVLLQNPYKLLTRSGTKYLQGYTEEAKEEEEEPSVFSQKLVPATISSTPCLAHDVLAGLVAMSWHRWTPSPEIREEGIWHFFLSALLFDWCLFVAAVIIAVLLRVLVVNKLTASSYGGVSLIFWFVLAGIYNALIWYRLGRKLGVDWLAGFLMETIFLLENIFVFRIIVHAFCVPKLLVIKVLQIVLCCQIIFEMIFFMGLAKMLRTLKFLPYVLGAWLVCCGIRAASESDDTELDIMNTGAFRALKSCLGDRLTHDYNEDGHLFRSAGGKQQVSLLFIVTCCLLLVDFLLEIDVLLADRRDPEFLYCF